MLVIMLVIAILAKKWMNEYQKFTLYCWIQKLYYIAILANKWMNEWMNGIERNNFIMLYYITLYYIIKLLNLKKMRKPVALKLSK